MIRHIRKSFKVSALALLSVVMGCSPLAVLSQPAAALSGAEFNAGWIIDDPTFFNGGDFSASEIQNFMNNKLAACDTNGDQLKTYTYNGSTVTTSRAIYASRNSYPAPPYVCAKDYQEDAPAKAADAYCSGAVAAGRKTAAQIIADAGRACGVNPKVLLVLLQKEQSLLTDDWPWPNQYSAATGYACPDTAPCDPEFAGLFNQIYYAARQYQRYAKQPELFSHRAGRENQVRYSPNAACGSSTVYIQNQATAGLYNYTPYQPNAAALNNLYGTGDGCSAYGNRNFWRLYSDWFGSPIGCPQVNPDTVYRLHRYSDDDYIFTRNASEICAAVKKAGYVNDGAVFNPIANNALHAISVFRLSRNSKHIFTVMPGERDLAMSLGYLYQDVAFYGRSTPTTNYLPVTRLTKDGHYILTASESEKQSFMTTGFANEGTVFYSPTTSTRIPIYRITRNGYHLYTSSAVEKDMAIQFANYKDEGIAFYAQSGPSGDNLSVYRHERGSRYFLTSNVTESKAAHAANFRTETSNFYVYPSNHPGTNPVYRLVSRDNGDYLYTTNPAERDLAASNEYTYEGIGFSASP